jgi:hypothetical protein
VLPAVRVRTLLIALGLGGILAAPARSFDEPAPAPLPEPRAFFVQVRERLHTDDYLLDQYTFTERQTERQLDGKGKVKKITSALYEVYPSPEPGQTYRRLVEKDGKPLSSEELAREDRKQEAKEAKAWARLGANDAQKRAAAERSRRRETEAIEELFRIHDFRIVGRETLDGRAAILVTFSPRPGVEPVTRAGKVFKKFAGRAWIDEEDRQLARVEAELIDDFSIGFGFIAKLKKGARAELLRRKINHEIWLPAEVRFAGNARLLLFRGLHIDTLSEYSDYKKFTVGTEAAVTPEQKK